MPKNVHATAVAGFTYALHAAGDRAFGAFWMDNVFLKGGRAVQLGNDGERNVKQADGCWGPCAGHRAPTVVLEVGAAQTLAALRGDVGRWFVPGAATNLAILLSTTKRAGAGPACVVEMYTPVRAAAPKLIYRGAWHADASEPPPCAVPLAAFFAADAQLQVPAGAEVNIPPEAMRTVYRAVCGAVQEEEEEERQREMV
ncbi:hypothetical protein FB451DRAFT_1216316 [Mycena latifolia]|nr:hypothetical protein FB451DRAFT_1216316 [Mycena latifolia]